MASYYYETREFAISDAGIHLLRDRYNYRTIRFSDTNRIIIERGKETPNWIGAFLLGTVILYTAVDASMLSIDNFVFGNKSAGYLKILVFLLLFGCAGGCFVYSSVQHGIILRISYGKGKHDRFPLRTIIRQGQFNDLLFLLTSKLDSKLIVRLKQKSRQTEIKN
jgi:hypothetical protein